MNPFNSSKMKQQMVDAMKQVRDNNPFALPDAVSDAAKAAGAEFKSSSEHTKETQTSIYKKHWDGIDLPANDLGSRARDAFNSIADGEAYS